MKIKIANLLLLMCGLVVGGCAAANVGSGNRSGASAYLTGKVARTYDAEYHQAVQASIETLGAFRMAILGRTSDELKTTIDAKRQDGTPVTVEVVRIRGTALTEVGVRTGAVGVTQLDVSEQIQKRIKERLAKTAKESQTSFQATSRRCPPELTIYFNRDSNELLWSEIEKLDKIAETVAHRAELKLTLNGYSDSLGSMDYNQMISEARATTVKMYLAGKGIDPRRIAVFAHGAKNFASSNETEEGRQMNRRVEISLESE